ncbi:MAG: hypothetical protein FJ280_02570 [Planctomycetes bacterium]|nr:hypothetical protein [Planctomycetota bacterium]
MTSTKFQIPSTKSQTNPNYQKGRKFKTSRAEPRPAGSGGASAGRQRFEPWCFDFWICLGFGIWNLELISACLACNDMEVILF